MQLQENEEESRKAADGEADAPSTSAAHEQLADSPRPPAVVIASGRESQRLLREQLAEQKRQSGAEEQGRGKEVVREFQFVSFEF